MTNAVCAPAGQTGWRHRRLARPERCRRFYQRLPRLAAGGARHEAAAARNKCHSGKAPQSCTRKDSSSTLLARCGRTRCDPSSHRCTELPPTCSPAVDALQVTFRPRTTPDHKGPVGGGEAAGDASAAAGLEVRVQLAATGSQGPQDFLRHASKQLNSSELRDCMRRPSCGGDGVEGC